MAVKQWEATDLKMGRIEIEECMITTEGIENPGLRVTRYYQYVDSNGDVLSDLGGRGITVEQKLTDIPHDILAALQSIDAFTYAKAKTKEGL